MSTPFKHSNYGNERMTLTYVCVCLCVCAPTQGCGHLTQLEACSSSNGINWHLQNATYIGKQTQQTHAMVACVFNALWPTLIHIYFKLLTKISRCTQNNQACPIKWLNVYYKLWKTQMFAPWAGVNNLWPPRFCLYFHQSQPAWPTVLYLVLSFFLSTLLAYACSPFGDIKNSNCCFYQAIVLSRFCRQHRKRSPTHFSSRVPSAN